MVLLNTEIVFVEAQVQELLCLPSPRVWALCNLALAHITPSLLESQYNGK